MIQKVKKENCYMLKELGIFSPVKPEGGQQLQQIFDKLSHGFAFATAMDRRTNSKLKLEVNRTLGNPRQDFVTMLET